MKYIHLFDSNNQFDNYYYNDNTYEEPCSILTEVNGVKKFKYNKTQFEKMQEIPLTFEILSNGTIIWRVPFSNYGKTIQYSKNNGSWTNITSTAEGAIISVRTGDIVKFKGDNDIYCDYTISAFRNMFNTTCNFKIYGNIMSLFNSTQFKDIVDFPNVSNNSLVSFFYGCTGLTDASDLVLPVTSLTTQCYSQMFYDCTNLINAPTILPAKTLGEWCYSLMFYGCTSLTTAPELPATSLPYGCYSNMFKGCTNLVTAPQIFATTLTEMCCSGMFYGCTSLTTGPYILPAKTIPSYAYDYMFYDCTSLTKPPKLPAINLSSSCYNSMFYGCISLVTAPELPATTIPLAAYYNMFDGCTNLNYVKCLATSFEHANSTSNWLNGVSASGTFVKNSNMSSWTSGSDGIPAGWTVQNAN